MKFLPKHRKLIYVPGMISLLLLPIAGYWYFNYTKSFFVPYCIDIGLPSNDIEDFGPWPAEIPKPKILTAENVVAMRQYKTFDLNGSEAYEAQKLKKLQLEFRRLKKAGDTINGVRVHFGKHAQYETFIRTLDYLAIEGMPIWGLYGNNIYALVPPPPKPSKNFSYSRICGGNFIDYIEPFEESKIDIIIFALKKDWKIYSALAVLILINIFSLVGFNKNKVLYLNNHSKWRF
jgi:hypothetical protein